MTAFWILVAIGAVIYFVRKARAATTPAAADRELLQRQHEPEGAREVSVTGLTRSAPRGRAWDFHVLPDGGVFVLSSAVTLTVRGDAGRVREMDEWLRTSASVYFPERAIRLAIFMSRHNLECPEVEDFRKKIVRQVRNGAKAKVQAEQDPAVLSGDPELAKDLLAQAEHDVYEELAERPSYWRTLDEIEIERPADLSADDAFLASVSHDPAKLRHFSNALGRTVRVAIVREGQGLPEWVELVNAGLAWRGTDIPPAALARVYKLADINAAAKLQKPVRRKADAAAVLTPEVIARLPDISRAFLVKPVPEEIQRGVEQFGWAVCHANLFLETIRCAEHVKMALERTESEFDEWLIDGDCCKKARSAADRQPTRRRPKNLPPYHVGCSAYVQVH